MKQRYHFNVQESRIWQHVRSCVRHQRKRTGYSEHMHSGAGICMFVQACAQWRSRTERSREIM